MEPEVKQFFRWSDKYSVQIEIIDKQHKHLFEIINELYTAFNEKNTHEKLAIILEKLIEYTKYHFSEEEKYFNQFDYEDSKAHIQKHNEFFETVLKLKNESGKKELMVTYQLMSFLRNWLVDHILVQDHEYMKCFKSNGLK